MQIEIEQHVDRLFRFALSLTGDRHLAEDLTQDCCLRAFRCRANLRNGAAAKTWLFQILLNLWKDHLKQKRIPFVALPEIGIADLESRPEDKFIQQEEQQQIFQLMQQLPGQQRAIIFLSVVEQLANREIAVLLESSENAVKANLHVARMSLRKRLAARKTEEHEV